MVPPGCCQLVQFGRANRPLAPATHFALSTSTVTTWLLSAVVMSPQLSPAWSTEVFSKYWLVPRVTVSSGFDDLCGGAMMLSEQVPVSAFAPPLVWKYKPMFSRAVAVVTT